MSQDTNAIDQAPAGDAHPMRSLVGSDIFYPIRIVTTLGALLVAFLYT
jgi:hypothetical protein